MIDDEEIPISSELFDIAMKWLRDIVQAGCRWPSYMYGAPDNSIMFEWRDLEGIIAANIRHVDRVHITIVTLDCPTRSCVVFIP